MNFVTRIGFILLSSGVLAFANEDDGFKLSPEAERKFEIQRKKIVSSTAIEISKDVIVEVGIEKNIFRYRKGFYKRIDFEIEKRAGKNFWIHSHDLKTGDEIVVLGTGFLRIAEIAAFDGAPEGHSH